MKIIKFLRSKLKYMEFLSKRHKPSCQMVKQTVAMVISLALLLPSLTWAFEAQTFQADAQPVFINGLPIKIPAQLGKIDKFFQGNEKLVIHIQDLHCNYEVQSNISGIIGLLAGRHKVKLVGIEGASLPVNVSKLSTFPFDSVKKEVGDYYVKLGKISGPEFYAAIGRHPIILEGVEIAEHYAANRKCVNGFLNNESQGYVYDLRDMLEKIKADIYDSRLMKFDAQKTAFREGKLATLEYAVFLGKYAAPRGISLDDYPQLKEYIFRQQSTLSLKIDPDQLFNELEELDTRLRAGLYTTTEQRELDEQLRRLDIIEKLLNISADSGELAEYQAYPETFQIEQFIKFLSRYENPDNFYPEQKIYEIDYYLDLAEEFYGMADQRSLDFVENLTQRMDKHNTKQAVLVTGGYHTKLILEKLRKQGISYISVKPRLSRIDSANPYFSLLRNRSTALEKLLARKPRLMAIASAFMRIKGKGDTKVILNEAELPEDIRIEFNVLQIRLVLWRIHKLFEEGKLSEEILQLIHTTLKSEYQEYNQEMKLAGKIMPGKNTVLIPLQKRLAVIYPDKMREALFKYQRTPVMSFNGCEIAFCPNEKKNEVAAAIKREEGRYKTVTRGQRFYSRLWLKAAGIGVIGIGLNLITATASLADTFIKIPVGATLSGLARVFKSTVGELKNLNPNITDINKIYAGDSLKIPIETEAYSISTGDTLSQIAGTNDTAVLEQYKVLNSGIENIDTIYAGDSIRIPAQGVQESPAENLIDTVKEISEVSTDVLESTTEALDTIGESAGDGLFGQVLDVVSPFFSHLSWETVFFSAGLFAAGMVLGILVHRYWAAKKSNYTAKEAAKRIKPKKILAKKLATKIDEFRRRCPVTLRSRPAVAAISAIATLTFGLAMLSQGQLQEILTAQNVTHLRDFLKPFAITAGVSAGVIGAADVIGQKISDKPRMTWRQTLWSMAVGSTFGLQIHLINLGVDWVLPHNNPAGAAWFVELGRTLLSMTTEIVGFQYWLITKYFNRKLPHYSAANERKKYLYYYITKSPVEFVFHYFLQNSIAMSWAVLGFVLPLRSLLTIAEDAIFDIYKAWTLNQTHPQNYYIKKGLRGLFGRPLPAMVEAQATTRFGRMTQIGLNYEWAWHACNVTAYKVRQMTGPVQMKLLLEEYEDAVKLGEFTSPGQASSVLASILAAGYQNPVLNEYLPQIAGNIKGLKPEMVQAADLAARATTDNRVLSEISMADGKLLKNIIALLAEPDLSLYQYDPAEVSWEGTIHRQHRICEFYRQLETLRAQGPTTAANYMREHINNPQLLDPCYQAERKARLKITDILYAIAANENHYFLLKQAAAHEAASGLFKAAITNVDSMMSLAGIEEPTTVFVNLAAGRNGESLFTNDFLRMTLEQAEKLLSLNSNLRLEIIFSANGGKKEKNEISGLKDTQPVSDAVIKLYLETLLGKGPAANGIYHTWNLRKNRRLGIRVLKGGSLYSMLQISGKLAERRAGKAYIVYTNPDVAMDLLAIGGVVKGMRQGASLAISKAGKPGGERWARAWFKQLMKRITNHLCNHLLRFEHSRLPLFGRLAKVESECMIFTPAMLKQLDLAFSQLPPEEALSMALLIQARQLGKSIVEMPEALMAWRIKSRIKPKKLSIRLYHALQLRQHYILPHQSIIRRLLSFPQVFFSGVMLRVLTAWTNIEQTLKQEIISRIETDIFQHDDLAANVPATAIQAARDVFFKQLAPGGNYIEGLKFMEQIQLEHGNPEQAKKIRETVTKLETKAYTPNVMKKMRLFSHYLFCPGKSGIPVKQIVLQNLNFRQTGTPLQASHYTGEKGNSSVELLAIITITAFVLSSAISILQNGMKLFPSFCVLFGLGLAVFPLAGCMLEKTALFVTNILPFKIRLYVHNRWMRRNSQGYMQRLLGESRSLLAEKLMAAEDADPENLVAPAYADFARMPNPESACLFTGAMIQELKAHPDTQSIAAFSRLSRQMPWLKGRPIGMWNKNYQKRFRKQIVIPGILVELKQWRDIGIILHILRQPWLPLRIERNPLEEQRPRIYRIAPQAA